MIDMQTDNHFLDLFFYPSSIAVVGASKNPFSLNFNLLSNLVRLGYPGRIYPVNPNADEILGLKAYPNLNEINDEVDLVITAVPAVKTLDVIKDCVQKKVKGVVLVSGGFSEIGVQGMRQQDEIAQLLKKGGIRAIGPNTLSPINYAHNMVISFYPVEKVKGGTTSFIFQSGMYDLRLSWLFDDFRLGISKIIDLGNKMDINEVDALEYLAGDESTKVICIHLETIKGDGKKFVRFLRDVPKKKPVVVLKTGRTEAGVKAAASHTGSIVRGSDTVFDSVLKQTGISRAQNLDEFFDFAKAFEFLNPPRGNKCVIASISGGEGVLAADICQQEGFAIVNPAQETVTQLKRIFPPWEIPVNPLDIGVSMQFHQFGEPFAVFVEAMSNDASVDCLVVQLPNIKYLFPDLSLFPVEEFCKPFWQAKEKGKVVVTWAVSANKSDDPLAECLESHRIPVYPSVSRAVKALAAVYRYKTIHLT